MTVLYTRRLLSCTKTVSYLISYAFTACTEGVHRTSLTYSFTSLRDSVLAFSETKLYIIDICIYFTRYHLSAPIVQSP